VKKKRVIPVLLLKDGFIVQSKEFSRYQNLGNPTTSVKRVSEWGADELIYLDISGENAIYDMRREDLGHPNRSDITEIISDLSEVCNMPITYGGNIRNIEQINHIIKNCADKVCMNTAAIKNIDLIEQGALEFGSQCMVVSIDFKKIDGQYIVMSDGGQVSTGITVMDHCKKVQDHGAGEILLNSVDRDGRGNGFEIELYKEVTKQIKIPIIALGGCGDWFDFADLLDETDVDAVAAANIFHYSDQSVYLARKYLFEKGYNVRPPILLKTDATSAPSFYNHANYEEIRNRQKS
jgi:cyclase